MKKHSLTEEEKIYIQKNAMNLFPFEIAESLGLKYETVYSYLLRENIPYITINTYKRHHSRLTKKEFEVLSLVAKGYSNREICEELFLAKCTIQTHLNSIYTKFGISGTKRHGAELRVKITLKYLEEKEGLLHEINY